MKKITNLLFALLFGIGLSSATNYIEGWDGNGATGVGTEPTSFGWEFSSPEMSWGIVNAGGNRYRDGINWPHEDGVDMAGLRQFMARWDIGGTTSDYYSYPVTLEAGKVYEFSWDYGWGNTGSNPEMIVSVGTEKDGSHAIATASFATPLTKERYRHGEFSFFSPTSEQYYLNITTNTGAWYGATNLSITEITTPSIMIDKTELSYAEPGLSETVVVTPIYLTEDISITVPSGFSVDINSIAKDEGPTAIEIAFDGTESSSGFVVLTSGEIETSIAVEGIADPLLELSKTYLTFDDHNTTGTFIVTKSNLSEEVSVAVPSGFSVDNATIDKATGDATITVTFDGLAESKGYITLTSGGTTSQIRVLGFENFTPLYESGNLIEDPYFNDLSTYGGWGAGAKSITTDTTEIYSGKSSYKVIGACGGSLDYSLTGKVSSDTYYRLRAMLKTTGNFTFIVNGCDVDGSNDKKYFHDTQGEWEQIDEIFKTGTIGASNNLYFNSCEGDRGTLAYMDNYELYKMPMFISKSSLEFLEGGDKTVAVTAQTLTEEITITAPEEFSVSLTSLSASAEASVVPITFTGAASSSGYVVFTSGDYTESVFVEGTADPKLIVSETLLTFDDQAPTATFKVTGGNLSEDITISAPEGFSVDNTSVDKSAGETTITITFDAIAESRGYVTVKSNDLSEEIRVVGFKSTYVPLYPTGNLLPDPYMTAKEPSFTGWGGGKITTDTLLVYDGRTSYHADGKATGWPDGATLDYRFTSPLESTTYYCLKAMVKTMDGTFTFSVKNADIEGTASNNLFTMTVPFTDGLWEEFYTTFLTGNITGEQDLFFNNADGGATGTQAFLDNYEMYKLPIFLSKDSISFEGAGESTIEVTAQLESTDEAYAITVPDGITVDVTSVAADEKIILTVSYDNGTGTEGYIVFDNGTYTDSVYVKASINVPVSLPSTSSIKDVVYVNNDEINVKVAITQSGEVTYQVFNLQGALVATQINNYTVGTHRTVIEGNFPAGIYLVNIIKGEEYQTYKIIK